LNLGFVCFVCSPYFVIVIILHRLFVIANNVGARKMPLDKESSSFSSSSSSIIPTISSSFSSSSDGLTFVINDSDDEIVMSVVQHLIERQQDPQHFGIPSTTTASSKRARTYCI